MLKVNTIDNVAYNMQERERLDRELRRLEDERQRVVDAIPNDDEHDDEFNKACDKYSKMILNQWHKCFAAQFPRCRNEWFTNVINNMPIEEWKHITEKQHYVFGRYARYSDNFTWKTHETYCRVGNKLVTLVWKNGFRAIKVELI